MKDKFVGIAKVGEKVHFTIICKNEAQKNTLWGFAYYQEDPDNFTMKQTMISNVEKTEDGYSLIADRIGWICIFGASANQATDDIPMVKVSGN